MRLQRSSPKVPWPHVLIEGRKYEAYQLPADAFDGQRLGVRDGDKVLADPRHHQDLTLVPVEARKGAIGLVIDPISKYFATCVVVISVEDNNRVRVKDKRQGRALEGAMDRSCVVNCSFDRPII
jgi:hypothetical protein